MTENDDADQNPDFNRRQFIKHSELIFPEPLAHFLPSRGRDHLCKSVLVALKAGFPGSLFERRARSDFV